MSSLISKFHLNLFFLPFTLFVEETSSPVEFLTNQDIISSLVLYITYKLVSRDQIQVFCFVLLHDHFIGIGVFFH